MGAVLIKNDQYKIIGDIEFKVYSGRYDIPEIDSTLTVSVFLNDHSRAKIEIDVLYHTFDCNVPLSKINPKFINKDFIYNDPKDDIDDVELAYSHLRNDIKADIEKALVMAYTKYNNAIKRALIFDPESVISHLLHDIAD
jgi:hypothetical protein